MTSRSKLYGLDALCNGDARDQQKMVKTLRNRIHNSGLIRHSSIYEAKIKIKVALQQTLSINNNRIWLGSMLHVHFNTPQGHIRACPYYRGKPWQLWTNVNKLNKVPRRRFKPYKIQPLWFSGRCTILGFNPRSR